MVLLFRVGYFFRANSYVGRLIVITRKMISDIVCFIVLVIIAILGGAILMDPILRTDYDLYSSFLSSIISLSYGTLGHADFLDNVSGGFNLQQILGNIILIVFFICVIILMINLLIAILNNSYSELKDHGYGK